MTIIAVQIEQTTAGLVADFSRDIFGSKRDNNAYEFRFTRPVGYERHDLTIEITDTVYGQLPAQNLGKKNIWKLTNAYTLSARIQVRLVFTCGDNYTESTAISSLQLREINQRDPKPIPQENPLWYRSFVSVTESDGELVFGNMSGKEIARIKGGSGTPGKDGEPGEDGADGKSAYESALDGGYTGTEAQFNADLATVSKKSQTLIFTNKSIAPTNWNAISPYADYPYSGSFILPGVAKEMIPTVVFAPSEAATGNYAPVADSFSGGVDIYAKEKPTTTITVPTITMTTGTVVAV